MYKKLVHTFILLYSLHIIASNDVKISNIPAWVKKINYSTPKDTSVESSAGTYYLLVDEQYHLKLESNFFHYTYKLLTQEGVENNSELSVNFDPSYQKLFFHKIDIIRNGKRINKLSDNNIKVLQRETSLERKIYDGSKDAVVVLSDTRVGDIIDYQYSLVGSNPIFENKFSNVTYFQFGVPVLRLSLIYYAPKSRPLFYVVKGDKNKIVEKILEEKETTTYTWNSENIAPEKTENETPDWFISAPYITISEYKDWKGVHSWALQVFKSVDPTLSNEFKAKIDEWKLNGKEAAFDSILYFVKDNIRYLGFESGINSILPTSCKKVYERRFGDCKDKSLLLASALRYLGINAFPALVNSYLLSQIKTQQPRATAFNHCVVYAVYKGKSYWFDPTISFQRGGYQNMYFPDYKTALVLAKDMNYLFDIFQTRKCNIEVHDKFTSDDFNSPTQLDVQTTYEGVEADEIRQYFFSNTKADIKKSYQDFYASSYPNIKMVGDVTFRDNISENLFVVDESYLIEDFWTKDSVKEKIVSANYYPIFMKSKVNYVSYAERNFPLRLEYPLKIKHTMLAKLPEEWNLQPFNNELINKYFRYKESATLNDDEIEAIYEYETFAEAIQAKDYKKIYADINGYRNGMGIYLTRKIDQDATIAPIGSLNILMVIIAISFAAISIYLGYKLYLYSPITNNLDNKPFSLDGWLYIFPLSLAFSFFSTLKDLLPIIPTYFDAQIWHNINDPSLATYNPTLAILLIFELFFNTTILLAPFLLIILFFQRRNTFPILMIGCIIYRIVFSFLDTIVADYTSKTAPSLESYTPLFLLLLNAVIWIPILIVSTKVKYTFTLPFIDRKLP